MKDASPLRYPGGKWRLKDFFFHFINLNFTNKPNYFEPYAGGCSLALSLLFNEKVDHIFLNDIDPAIYSFWKAIITETERFIELVRKIELSPKEWKKQKSKLNDCTCFKNFEKGFASFYLNRTNHSGILNGGMIGGKSQLGTWKIDARFNRDDLIRRIRRVAEYSNRIHIYNHDALDFFKLTVNYNNKLFYLDPPYYHSGRTLYYNSYTPKDHIKVRNTIIKIPDPWILSYDDNPDIRGLYKKFRLRQIKLLHTARTSRIGNEIVFFSKGVKIPKNINKK